MTEPGNSSALSTASYVPSVHTRTATATSREATDAASPGLKWIRWLVRTNLVLVGLQPISAGLFLSGYGRAVAIHAAVALALQLGALVQVVTAAVLWRRRRVPAWVAGISIGLFVMVFLEVGLGYNRRYWLHVPIGVGIFGGLIRQASRLDTLWRADGVRS